MRRRHGKFDRRAQRFACLVIGVFLTGCAAEVEPLTYAELEGGISTWDDTSNDDEVESDSDDHLYFGGSVGREYGWSLGKLRLGGALVTHIEETHGANDPPFKSERNETGTVTSLMLNVQPVFRIYGPIFVSLRARAGPALASFFGDEDVTYGLEGAGMLGFEYSGWAVYGGYRYFDAGSTDHDGFEANYESHGPFLGLSLKW